MNRDTGNEVLEMPPVPRRVLTASDWLLALGAPVILYLGGVAAAGGSVAGLILVGFAGLVVITLRTVRLGRRNEPRVPRWSGYGAAFVAVFGFVWSWDFFHNPLGDDMWQYVWPAVPVALYLVFVLAMFVPRAAR